MTRCKFKQGNFNCGSYAFNLYKEDINQGDYCDHHYWQDQATKARVDERKAIAKFIKPTEEHRRDASWGYMCGDEGVAMLDDLVASILRGAHHEH